MRAFLLSILIGASALSCLAQTVGKLRLLVDPGGNYQFVLDHKYRMQQRELELGIGAHHFSFWAPQRQIVDTTFNVMEGRTQDVVVRLPYSAEYRQYQNDIDHYRSRMWTHRLIPAVASVGGIAWSVLSYVNFKDAHEKLDQDVADYNAVYVPSELTKLKTVTIPADKDAFSSARTSFYVSTGITTAVLLGTAWLWMKSSKRAVPTFDDKEKVKFDGLVMIHDAHGSAWCAAITIPIR